MKESRPNFTQIPNWYLDNVAKFNESETKVLLVLFRKIYGWHKEVDRIAISQFMASTGLSNRAIITALQNLEKKGVITRKRTRMGVSYTILEPDQEMKNVHLRSEESSHTKETSTKESSKSHCLQATPSTYKQTKVSSQDHIQLETIVQQEQIFFDEKYVIKYPIQRRHQKQLMKDYSLNEIISLFKTFCTIRQNNKILKGLPILMTSLTHKTIPLIQSSDEFKKRRSAVHKSEEDNLTELNDKFAKMDGLTR